MQQGSETLKRTMPSTHRLQKRFKHMQQPGTKWQTHTLFLCDTDKNHQKFRQKPNSETAGIKQSAPRFHVPVKKEAAQSLSDVELLDERGLKPKELMVLQHLAAGESLKSIEQKHPITHYYASNLLVRLRRQLGGISKDRLMYLVGLHGLLEPETVSSNK